jgi:hypothetical protein
MFMVRIAYPVRHILPQLTAVRPLIVHNKWDSVKNNININGLVGNQNKTKINIKSIPNDVTDSISLNDYAKMTFMQTSTNILGIGAVTTVSIFTGATLMSQGISDLFTLCATAMAVGLIGGVYTIVKIKDYTILI